MSSSMSDPNPYESPSQPESTSASPVLAIVLAIAGALVGAVSFAQTFSAIGFFLDVAAHAGMTFRLLGTAGGLLVGLPIGAIAGWLIGSGRRRVDYRAVGIGTALLGILFSSSLFLVSGRPPALMVMMPLVGMFSGAILGAIISVLMPGRRMS